MKSTNSDFFLKHRIPNNLIYIRLCLPRYSYISVHVYRLTIPIALIQARHAVAERYSTNVPWKAMIYSCPDSVPYVTQSSV